MEAADWLKILKGWPTIREMARLLVTSASIIPNPTQNLTVRRATRLRYTRRARQFGELHHPQCFPTAATGSYQNFPI